MVAANTVPTANIPAITTAVIALDDIESVSASSSSKICRPSKKALSNHGVQRPRKVKHSILSLFWDKTPGHVDHGHQLSTSGVKTLSPCVA